MSYFRTTWEKESQQILLTDLQSEERVVKDFSQISNLVNWSVSFHVVSRGYRRRYTFINGSSVFCFANVEFGVPVETPRKISVCSMNT